MIEKLFSVTWWDYSDHLYHIGKYVALDMSLIWGFAAIILIYLVKPLMDKIIKKIPNFIGIIMLLIIISDFIITIFTKIKIN